MKFLSLKIVLLSAVWIVLLFDSHHFVYAGDHPKLILNPSIIDEILQNKNDYALLKTSVSSVIKSADNILAKKMSVPFPKDPAGGFTHECHKQNGSDMKTLGIAYQLTGEKKYAIYVGEMLLKYAELYPTLGIHPEKRNNWAGKLFWQGLNEAVWMVDVLQAYDAIYNTLTQKKRELIEDQLLLQVVNFFLEYKDAAFDRMSNHGTWAIAAVGMTGLLLDDANLVEMALYGSNKDGQAGFMKQLDVLFSPDGYYAEGPYYQRYAMLPFIVFAQSLFYNRPDLKIMKYRDGIVLKAVETLLQLTSETGVFFPINDALKTKDFRSSELIPVVDIAFQHTNNNQLLDIAKNQKKVSIDEAGLKVAKAIENGNPDKFIRKPALYSDGFDGTKGGIGLMRQGYKKPSVLFKFASQGMGHGHFDRLSFLYYNQGKEIFGDYGAARYVNVATKDGGRYLKENKTWAKQSIAHNTMVVNEISHFDGKLSSAEQNSPKLLFYDISDPNFQIFSAVDSNCYENTNLHRTLALVNIEGKSVMLDVFNCTSSDDNNVYDYVLHYNGQPTSFSFDINASLRAKEVLGQHNGYQHLWVDAIASGFNNDKYATFTFLEGESFYTVSTTVSDKSEIYFTQLGANDPNFNLRNERGMVVRTQDIKNHLNFTAIEPHGKYISSREYSRGSEPEIKNMQIAYQDDEKAAFIYESGKSKIILFLCLAPKVVNQKKQIKIEDKYISWKGWYHFELK